jgi:hypothetical protein
MTVGGLKQFDCILSVDCTLSELSHTAELFSPWLSWIHNKLFFVGIYFGIYYFLWVLLVNKIKQHEINIFK